MSDPAGSPVEPLARLEHVMVGQDLAPDDLRWLALELYRREYGMCWIGETPTARMMNIVIDWWNGGPTDV